MTAKEELNQYRFKVKKVSEALEEYERFKDRATKITAVLSENPIHSNKVGDKVGDNAIKMADLSNEYLERWNQAEHERITIIEKIDAIKKEPYRTLLYGIYIEGKSLEMMCGELAKRDAPPLSYDRIIHLHR